MKVILTGDVERFAGFARELQRLCQKYNFRKEIEDVPGEEGDPGDLTTLDGCGYELARVLNSDSAIPLTRSQVVLTSALRDDMRGGEKLPTKEEIDELVMGDAKGKIPTRLVKRYKNVDKVLKTFF